MSEPASSPTGHGEPSRDEMMSALFASMVMQQAQMAMLYLGRMPHPETGQPMRDLEAARMFIDQLEMLEAKTKGNLSKEEAMLLKQSLSSVRLAFVQSVEGEEEKKPAAQPAQAGSTAEKKDEPAPAEATATSQAAAAEAEERKKFVKKY